MGDDTEIMFVLGKLKLRECCKPTCQQGTLEIEITDYTKDMRVHLELKEVHDLITFLHSWENQKREELLLKEPL